MAINFSTGFDLRTTESIDRRFVLSKAEMLQERYTDGTVIPLPNNYLCVCRDDGQLYTYTAGNTYRSDTGRFRISSADIQSSPIKIKGIDYNYIENEHKPVQVKSAIEDSDGNNISQSIFNLNSEILSKQNIIGIGSEVNSDFIDDTLSSTHKFISIVEKQQWERSIAEKQDRLIPGENISIDNNIISAIIPSPQIDIHSYTTDSQGIIDYSCGVMDLINDIGQKTGVIINGLKYDYLKYDSQIDKTIYRTVDFDYQYSENDIDLNNVKIIIKFIAIALTLNPDPIDTIAQIKFYEGQAATI